jgi:hypothetical protein
MVLTKSNSEQRESERVLPIAQSFPRSRYRQNSLYRVTCNTGRGVIALVPKSHTSAFPMRNTQRRVDCPLKSIKAPAVIQCNTEWGDSRIAANADLC